jgi:hypothetical protein
MNTPRKLIFAALLACSTATAAEWDYRVEGKLATAYDHEVVKRALEAGNRVALFHIRGALPRAEASRISVQTLAGSVPAAYPGSARVSLSTSSLSVAFDPRRTRVTDLQKDIERRLAAKKLSLVLLQVMDGTSDFSTSLRAALAGETPG